MEKIYIASLDKHDDRMRIAFNEYVELFHDIASEFEFRRPKAPARNALLLETESPTELFNALVGSKFIIHVSGHGSKSKSTIESPNAVFSAKQLADYLTSRNEYLDVECIILDSCFTADTKWRTHLTKCIKPGGSAILITSHLGLPFGQSKRFFSNFYSKLLSVPLPKNRVERDEWVKSAFMFAQRSLWFRLQYSRLRIETISRR